MKIAENFDRKEFACKCGCGYDPINPNPNLVQVVVNIQDDLDRHD